MHAPDTPSLNALRAFEAAARCGSFVLAAAELGVSAAAVSQQVKQLETQMARRLFLRQGNRILLTDAGREIYPTLEAAFREIGKITRFGAGRGVAGRLVISVLPWLAPWLVSALQGYEAPFEIRTEADPVALTRGEADLRLTYGGYLYPDHKVQPLFTDQMVIVSAKAHSLPKDLTALSQIHIHWGAAYASLPGWALWHSGQRVAMPDPARALMVSDPSTALGLVRDGNRTAILPKAALPPDHGFSTLDAALALSWPYVLVCLNARARNRPLAALIEHIAFFSKTANSSLPS